MGAQGNASATTRRSTLRERLSLRRHLPGAWKGRRHRDAERRYAGDAGTHRGNSPPRRARRSRDLADGSRGMAHDEQSRHAQEHHADLPTFARAGTEPAGKHLAVHATQLAFEPRVRKLRGHHRRYYGFYPNQEYNRYTRYQTQPSVAYSHQDYGVPSGLVSYGHMLQAAGYRVSEHPAFGGVHHVHHGWAHYAGRAIDVNIGTGMREAYNANARARFDVLAAQARAAGYTVLWRVAGHYDHIHIQR